MYITYGIYSEFDPIPESVNFEKQEALLKNRHSTQIPKDTLRIGRKTGYIVSKSHILRIAFKEINKKQYRHAD